MKSRKPLLFLLASGLVIAAIAVSAFTYYKGPPDQAAIAELTERLEKNLGDGVEVSVIDVQRHRHWWPVWESPGVSFWFTVSLISRSARTIERENSFFDREIHLEPGAEFEYSHSTLTYWRREAFEPWTVLSRGYATGN